MGQRSGRTVLALLVMIVTVCLLGLRAPRLASDLANFDQYALWLTVESAVACFFAAAIGAIVARKQFVPHAVVLATGTWLILTYLLYRIARPAANVSFLNIAAEQLLSLLLLVTAGMLGAILGRWFYRREIEAGQSAR